MRKGGIVSSGKVIAEQSFGFWTSLFETHHYRLINGSPIHAFPNKPTNANRKLINQKLNRIREFRNRIYHNEPICFNNSQIDFTEANQVKLEIYELLSWVDSEISDYVDYFDGIQSKIDTANKVY